MINILADWRMNIMPDLSTSLHNIQLYDESTIIVLSIGVWLINKH